MIYETKKIKYKRVGKCNRCGSCGCEKLKCPHFKWEKDLATCLIHDKLGQYCKECSEAKSKICNRKVIINHQGCIDFPVSPFQNVVKDNICGYKFIKIK